MASSPTNQCDGCGTEVAAALHSCPACGRLVHARQLKALAQQAEQAAASGDRTGALEHWRTALELLPPNSRQHQQVSGKIDALAHSVPASPQAASAAPATADTQKRRWGKSAAGVGALGLLLWKFKFVITFVLTKGKLLLLGLTKSSTLLSMLLSMGVYWAAWGWKFAVGLVLSIYVHEIGHVAALRHYGIKASSPMFIPGFGALVRLRQRPNNALEDARVGLAGPTWGLGAAVAAYGVGMATGWGSWLAIAKVGAWINLFNLLPVWQLDGGRGFRALARKQRWLAVAAVFVMWIVTAESMLFLLLLGGGFQAWRAEAPTESHRSVLWQYVALVVVLALLCTVEVPGLATTP